MSEAAGEEAEPPEETGATAEPEKEPRELKVTALLLGLPLVLFFVLPWDTTDPFALPAWLRAPLLAMGTVGATLVALAFARHRFRLVGVPLAGALLLGCGFWIVVEMAEFTQRGGVRHLSYLAAALWALVPSLAMGAEMAMHRHPRSRRIAVAALIGWSALIALLFLPQRGAFVWADTPLARLLVLLEQDRFTLRSPVVLPFAAACVGLIGVLQCVRRIGRDREAAAERRFRSSWLAWVLVPLPAFALTAWNVVDAALHHPGYATKNFYIGVCIVAPLLGGALAIRGLLGTRAFRERSLRPVLALAGVGALVAAGWVGYVAFVPHAVAEDAVVADLATEVGDAVLSGLQGEAVDRRFLGNYSSSDLRGAQGVVELPEGARVELAGFLIVTEGSTERHWGYALVNGEGELGWFALDDHEVSPTRDPYETPEWMLEPGEEPPDPGPWLVIPERFGAPGCRPTLALPEEPALAVHLAHAQPVCNPLQLRELGGPRFVDGSVEGYLVVLTGDSGERIALAGDLTTRARGAWIGIPRPLAEVARVHRHEKWVHLIE